MDKTTPVEPGTPDHERYETLQQLEEWLEWPVLVLGFAWLVLLVIELVRGLDPLLEALTLGIWVIFLLEFGVRFVLAPEKIPFLRRNWLTVLSLLVPALRIFRIFYAVRLLQAARAARSLRLVKVVGSLNRGMRALSFSMGRRGFGYVVLLTLVVTLVGAAGMYAFENDPTQSGRTFTNYGEALWWTAMIMTTLGSEKWPRTGEGQFLTLLLSLYAFAVFGYVTATLATFFIGREAESPESEVASQTQITALQKEVEALRGEIRELIDRSR